MQSRARRQFLQKLLGAGAAFALPSLPSFATGLAGDVSANPELSQALANRVWDARRQDWLNEHALIDSITRAPFVIVGERHDNLHHQAIERWVIDVLAKKGKIGGVAMEMIDPSQQGLISDKPSSYWQDLEDSRLQQQIAWQEHWNWQAYGQTVKNVFALDKPLLAANVPNSELKALARQPEPSLPKAVADFQRQAIIEGHCNLLPDNMIGGMLFVQVARDRAMAKALSSLPETGVLLCGAGHARLDVGVARYMSVKPLSIGLIEVESGDTLRDAIPKSANQQLPFDILWFTKAANRADPCFELTQRFAKKT